MYLFAFSVTNFITNVTLPEVCLPYFPVEYFTPDTELTGIQKHIVNVCCQWLVVQCASLTLGFGQLPASYVFSSGL